MREDKAVTELVTGMLRNVIDTERTMRKQAEDAAGHYSDQVDRLSEVLHEVAQCGVKFDDVRLGYVEVQIDRETWDSLQAMERGED